MKRVLFIGYSQSGQLHEVLRRLGAGFSPNVVDITTYQIELEKPYLLPWKKEDFYGVFPKTFTRQPVALKNMDDPVLRERYDLVVVGYQVWFLTPSIPINSFLRHPNAEDLLRDTPVVTVIACRNMWMQAQEKMKALLLEKQARLVGNIALVDRHLNHISVLTIAHWMFTGKKTRKWGFMPRPGVSDEDIRNTERFATPIQKALGTGKFETLQDELLTLDAVKIKPFLVLTDQRATHIFSKWAQFIETKSTPGSAKRKRLLVFFRRYLWFAIWVLAPIVFAIYLASYLLRLPKVNKDRSYYSSVDFKPTT